MRSLALVFAIILAASPAFAQSVAIHQAAAPTGTTPASGLASTIIPGSPLAALTGAVPDKTQPQGDVFGTENLGLSIMAGAARDASATIADFASAVRRSTRLTDVEIWLQSFPADPERQHEAMAALQGFFITLLPALLVEIIIRALLARPRAAIISIALARRAADDPEPEDEGIALAEAGGSELPPRKRLALGAWLTRFSLAFTYIILALLPLLGFFITSSFLIGGDLITSAAAQLIVVGAANAYLFCRVLNEALTFIFAPQNATLRLIHTTDARAFWLVRSLMLIIITIALGYTLIATAQTLGLAHEGALVLARLAALVVHIELAVLVWRSRHIVAGWIRGADREEQNFAFGIRPRLAAIWHYIALFYLIALWVAYAGGIQNAFAVLLRFIAVFIGVMIAARITWLGVGQSLDYIFDESENKPRRLETLRRRAKTYNPFLRLLARIIIAVLMLIALLAGWGLPVIPFLLKTPLTVALISAAIAILITIAVALILWEAANVSLAAKIDKLSAAGQTRQASRLRTLLPMLKATLGVVIFLTAALVCLGKIGVNLVPLLAVSGVAGIAIGFGSQKLVQDIITGLFLLLEDAMQVGDVITLAGMTGTVERLSIRTIRLRGGDGSINIIPFSAVTTVTNMTRDFGYAQISIQVGYKEDLTHVYAVLTDIGRAMRAEPAWGAMMRDDLQIFGLDSFGTNALVITGQIRTGPGQHWSVRREFYARVKQRFEAEHIEMPYIDMSSYTAWSGRAGAPPPQITSD